MNSLGKTSIYVKHLITISSFKSTSSVLLTSLSGAPKFEKALLGPDAEVWRDDFEDKQFVRVSIISGNY